MLMSQERSEHHGVGISTKAWFSGEEELSCRYLGGGVRLGAAQLSPPYHDAPVVLPAASYYWPPKKLARLDEKSAEILTK